MTMRASLVAIAAGLALTACGPQERPVVSSVAAVNPGVPFVDIAAPGARVRTAIAERARQRGTKVASNTRNGVVLERDLASTTPALEQSCGPHQPGRKVRIILATDEQPGRTVVSEQRYVVDGGGVCLVRLNAADMDEAVRSLDQLKTQIEGRAAGT
jgi:hypothetical protein